MAYIDHGYFHIRIPYLSFGYITKFFKKNKSFNDSSDELFSLFKLPYFNEALYIASAELHNEFTKCCEQIQMGNIVKEKRKQRISQSLYKYFVRMGTRCVPFGLFSGVSTGKIDTFTSIRITEGNTKYLKIFNSLDFDILCSISEYISLSPNYNSQLIYTPNNTIYYNNQTIKYYEPKITKGRKHYQLTSIKKSGYLDTVIRTAENGILLNKLIEELATNFNTSEDTASHYIKDLIKNKILLCEVEPNLTGRSYFDSLTSCLNTLDDIEKIGNKLSLISQLLNSGELGIKKFKSIADIASSILNRTLTEDRIIKTDLHFVPTVCSIENSIINKIKEQVLTIAPYLNSISNQNLIRFKKNFVDRYSHREISLLEALDPELGLKYIDSYGLDNTPIEIDNGDTHTNTSNKKNLRAVILEKYLEAARKKEEHLNINEYELQLLTRSEYELPNSIFMMGHLYSSNPDFSSFIFHLEKCTGSSGVNLMSRFCSSDTVLNDHVTSFSKAEEENENYLFAEILDLPKNRNGNILLRPRLRKYEIPLFARSTLPSEKKILLRNILISVEQNKIILRSKINGKRIIPILTSAHNYDGGSDLYRFLCDLQFDNKNVIDFSFEQWEKPLTFGFFPRVVFKNIVLKKASWVVNVNNCSEFQEVNRKNENELNEWKIAFTNFAKNYSLPSQFMFLDDDYEELYIDTENQIGLSIILNLLQKKKKIRLVECLANVDNLLVQSNNSSHESQIVIPFLNIESKQKTDSPLHSNQFKTETQRFSFPGDNWAYIKIYCNNETSDKVILDVLESLTRNCITDGLIQKWFFIRYRDPDYHLRVRFLLSPEANNIWGEIIMRVNNSTKGSIETGIIRKITYDTYEREIERYGANTISLCEDIFHLNSELVIQIIRAIRANDIHYSKTLISLRVVDSLLDIFGFKLDEKKKICEQNFSYIAKEIHHSGGENFKQNLSMSYRSQIKDISSVLCKKEEAEKKMVLLQHLLDRHEIDVKYIATEINLIISRTNEKNTFGLVADFIHMFFNRLFHIKQKNFECISYYFLYKHYSSKLAISAPTNNTHQS